jgi:hypothetical protein
LNNFIDTVRNEARSAPLATIGTICAVIALFSDLGGGLGAISTKSIYGDIAVASLKSLATVFLFSFASAKLFGKGSIAGYVIFAILGIVSSLLIAYYFDEIKTYYFNNTKGGVQDVFIYIGALFGAFYISVIVESSGLQFVEVLKNSAICIILAAYLFVFTIISMFPFSGWS